MGLVVHDIDSASDLSLVKSFLEMDVFPAPDGDERTIQNFLLLNTKD